MALWRIEDRNCQEKNREDFMSATRKSEESLLPEAIGNIDFEEYLHNFGDEVAFTSSASTSSSYSNSKRKVQYANELTNMSNRMTRYLKLEVILSNMQVPIQTTVRPL